MKRVVLTLLMLVLFAAPASASSLEGIWDDVHPLLSKAVADLEARGNVPDSSWNPFKEDKESVDDDINDLLNECIEILGISDMAETKAAIAELQQDSLNCRKKVAELRTERLAAPQKVEKWELWKKDVTSIDEEIKELEGREKDNAKRVEALVGQLLEEMRKLGMQVDREQVETLVYSVTGDDDVQMVSVFNNVKTITTELQRLTSQAGEEIEMAKRYYGMHTLLLRILLNLYQQYEHKIDEVYLVRIDGIVEKQEALMDKTEDRISNEPEKFRKIYQSNLKAQRLTRDTALLYADYLKKNRARIVSAREKVADEYDVALNTYETVQGAHSLISLMKNANAMLERMSGLQTPELMVFQNLEMKNEFKKLSERLAEG
ncbi:hypothetical protein GM415_02345 [Pseudodesulfovibrio cashew]|uniref:Uncharacterized protein n=1 Tax=Pseudodesulfovibrio cashew TaxID=2678688 RepID=A0A6I6JF38_9BACT|nr:hypothetical protein [Pseudodesulfovibrio cashew]QGY39022.1 hypothetical protein GM415_02345 [Pseudodesulfovibrio cashew]